MGNGDLLGDSLPTGTVPTSELVRLCPTWSAGEPPTERIIIDGGDFNSTSSLVLYSWLPAGRHHQETRLASFHVSSGFGPTQTILDMRLTETENTYMTSRKKLAMENHTHADSGWMYSIGTFSSSPVESQHVDGAKPETKQDMTWDLTCVSSHSVKLSSWQSWHENPPSPQQVVFWRCLRFFSLPRFCTNGERIMIHQIHPSRRSLYIKVSTCLLEWCLDSQMSFGRPGCPGQAAIWVVIAESNKGVLKSAVVFFQTLHSRFPHELAWRSSKRIQKGFDFLGSKNSWG